MFRSILIVLTALALLLSSSGISQIVHSCSMSEDAAAATDCPMCRDTEVTDDQRQSDASIVALPCCSFVFQSRASLSAVSIGRCSLPEQIATSPLFAGACTPRLLPIVGRRSLEGPTIALAERSRNTYLRVSSLLI